MTQQELESKYLNKRCLIEGGYLDWHGIDFYATIVKIGYRHNGDKTVIDITLDGYIDQETTPQKYISEPNIDEEDLDYFLNAIHVL